MSQFAMNLPKLLWSTLLAAGCLTNGLASLRSQEIPFSEETASAVLLKTDRILYGPTRREGDTYKIQVARDSSVSIPVSQVVHVADSKHAIYEYKKGQIKSWHGGDHFQLTHWCIANELLEEASAHYVMVAKLHPNHPRVQQLAVELKNRILEDPEFRDYLGLDPTPAEEVVAANAATGQPPGEVQLASAGFQKAAMHPEIAAHFSRRIQPILMNRCSQSACHGATGTNGFRILEPYRSAYDRISSDNLKSVLAFVSLSSQELSPLLRYATTAHGIQRQPAISITETQLLSEISNWIKFVQNPVSAAVAHATNGVNGPAVMTGASPRFTPFTPAVKLVPVQPGASGLKPVPQGGELQDFPNGDVPLESEIDALDQQLRQVLGEPSPAAGSSGAMPVAPVQDAFDPREFNQQSFPLRSPPQ